MTLRSLVVLIEVLFPGGTVRLVQGTGPMLIGGTVWFGAGEIRGLDEIEMAINGESSSFELALSGVAPTVAARAYEEYQADTVIGAELRLAIQPCDAWDQPVGPPRRRFTGRVGNYRWDSIGAPDGLRETIMVEVMDRMDLAGLPAGGMYTTADHRLRSPGDHFFDDVPNVVEVVLNWPDF